MTSLSPMVSPFFMTEIWLPAGDLAPFVKLTPKNCNFLNTWGYHLPDNRLWRWPGNLMATSCCQATSTTVFRDHFECRVMLRRDYRTSKLELFVTDLSSPVLGALVYRRVLIKDFIQEFSDFSFVTTKLLILGNFNIYTSKPSFAEFLQLWVKLNDSNLSMALHTSKDT